MLGAHKAVAFPKKFTLAMKHLGNAISTPHAVLAILVGYKSTVDEAIDIESLILECWNQRLTADYSLLCEGREFAKLLSIPEFTATIGGKHPEVDESCTVVEVCIRIPKQLRTFHTHVPSHWSLLHLYVEVMQIDPFAARRITCGNGVSRVDKHTTLRTMHAIGIEWKLYIKGADCAFLALGKTIQAVEIPPTMPYEIEPEGRATPPFLVLSLPTNDEILDSAVFARVIWLLERFYAALPAQIATVLWRRSQGTS